MSWMMLKIQFILIKPRTGDVMKFSNKIFGFSFRILSPNNLKVITLYLFLLIAPFSSLLTFHQGVLQTNWTPWRFDSENQLGCTGNLMEDARFSLAEILCALSNFVSSAVQNLTLTSAELYSPLLS